MKKKFMGVMLFVLGALAMVVFQQIGQTAPALTALDYEEIRNLYARYAVAADTGAKDGDMWAQVFTEDGVADTTNPSRENASPAVGYEGLKAMVNRVTKFRVENGIENTPTHYVTNLLIEPTAEGATGVAYSFSPASALGGAASGGTYHDQLVKTAEGWRFKKRTFTNGAFSEELLQALAQ